MSATVRPLPTSKKGRAGTPAKLADKPGESTGTVVRVVQLLRCMANVEEDVSLTELATTLALPPSTVHRLLHLLIDEGLVEQAASRHRYRPGVELFRLSAIVVSHTRITDVAFPFMQAVVDRCNENCLLVLYLPATHEVTITRVVNSNHPLRYEIEQFVPLSLLWGATGRSVLAFLPPAEILAAVASGGPSPVDGQKLPPAETFEAELAEIRRNGYAYTQNQKMPGAVGIGAPVYGAEGSVLGSLCVTIPQIRFRPRSAPGLGLLVKQQADLLSTSMGHRGHRTPRL